MHSLPVPLCSIWKSTRDRWLYHGIKKKRLWKRCLSLGSQRVLPSEVLSVSLSVCGNQFFRIIPDKTKARVAMDLKVVLWCQRRRISGAQTVRWISCWLAAFAISGFLSITLPHETLRGRTLISLQFAPTTWQGTTKIPSILATKLRLFFSSDMFKWIEKRVQKRNLKPVDLGSAGKSSGVPLFHVVFGSC